MAEEKKGDEKKLEKELSKKEMKKTKGGLGTDSFGGDEGLGGNRSDDFGGGLQDEPPSS